MDLDDFLEEALRTPFVDGVQDCALMTADWAVACGHPDPAAAYRGRYSTALGRERLLKREGGLVAVMSASLEASGLPTVERPQRGSIGAVELMGHPFAAICTGKRWAIKSSEGLMVKPADRLLKAWSVTHG